MKKPEELTPIGRMLLGLAKYKEYEVWGNTIGLAYEFNELCKAALIAEERAARAERRIKEVRKALLL